MNVRRSLGGEEKKNIGKDVSRHKNSLVSRAFSYSGKLKQRPWSSAIEDVRENVLHPLSCTDAYEKFTFQNFGWSLTKLLDSFRNLKCKENL